MCGIFGIIIKPGAHIPNDSIGKLLRQMAILSEARGKDSSGISFRIENDHTIHVIKGDIPIRQLLKSNDLNFRLKKSMDAFSKGNGFIAFGHARLVTNGSQLHEVNNQPVIKDGILVIHNGIIVNVDELWGKHPELTREYQIDTEIIPALIRIGLKNKKGLIKSCNEAFNQLTGTYSVAMMLNDYDEFVLATNNGSLYYITDDENYFVFASESYFLEQLLKVKAFRSFKGNRMVIPLVTNQGVAVNMTTLKIASFSILQEQGNPELLVASKLLKIEKHLLENQEAKHEVVIDPSIYINRSQDQHLFSLLEYNIDAISNLRRCTKCLLPETFPFIEFDKAGICNYCHNYKPKNQSKPILELIELVEPYRRKGGKPDCIVPFSGGRDSTYTLHIVKKELGLNPIAFTYDWGMVTDLARRNAARVCGKLGVENIIVAADIRSKRNNIRKNVKAWLKKPSLGMIPLFMAGDKYFFYYSNKILSQNNLELSIWGSNPLENTDFKSGFTGIKPHFDKKRIDDLNLTNKMRLIAFFGNNFLTNPSYFNSSLLDTFGSFTSRYLVKRYGYFQLFDFIRWEENIVEELILNEYNWEKSIDTKSTWRIGDGTAAFYNYIYYTVAGFSEFETFRSNQIREGQLTREKGLELIYQENKPRYENLRWYLDIIGLDFRSTIEQINKIPKLYKF